MVERRFLLGHRARLAAPVAADEEQQDDGEDERDRGAQSPTSSLRNFGEDGRRRSRTIEVLEDAQEQAARERDRDRTQTGERDGGERAEHDQRELRSRRAGTAARSGCRRDRRAIIVSTQAADDVRAAFTPRRPARSPRSTTARISSPRRVWRSTSHRRDRGERRRRRTPRPGRS